MLPVRPEGEPFTTPYVGGIQPGTITLGEKFSELGYVTHLNGKWGIGGGAFANTPWEWATPVSWAGSATAWKVAMELSLALLWEVQGLY